MTSSKPRTVRMDRMHKASIGIQAVKRRLTAAYNISRLVFTKGLFEGEDMMKKAKMNTNLTFLDQLVPEGTRPHSSADLPIV